VDTPVTNGQVHLHILLADDNEPFRRRVRKLVDRTPDIELLGEAVNGEEAVRLARELQPDVVITDVVMPRLNGIEATRRIKQESPGVEVIALSMHGEDGFRRAMLDAGASVYLLKDNVLHELPKVLSAMAGTCDFSETPEAANH
jgi:DNA-binding NarL/FixJ family response regulator